MNASALIVVALAVTVGAALQRLSGTGVGLVLGPVLAVALGPVQGILVTNLTTAISGFVLTLSVLSRIEFRRAVVIVVGALPGCLFGVALVTFLPTAVLQIVIGVVIIAGLWVTGRGHFDSVGPQGFSGPLCWFLGGVGNTSAGVAAPAMIVYAQITKWDQVKFAATMQPVFMSLGIISLSLKLAFERGSSGMHIPAAVGLAVLAALVLGLIAGLIFERRVESSHARTLAIWLAWAGACAAIVKGVATLALSASG